MTDQEIYKKIEDTYNSEKGKGFITHLLRSFMPLNRTYKLLSNDNNLKMVDCITGEKLSDVDAYFKLMKTENFANSMMENLKASAQAMVDGKESYDVPESVKNLKSKVNPMAITCEKSDKLMSEQTLGQLYNFFASQILIGNKHINWVANNERGKEFASHGRKSGFIENDREEKVVRKATERAKMSLGDLDVLRELKAKMENK